jgi:hypothetical protein
MRIFQSCIRVNYRITIRTMHSINLLIRNGIPFFSQNLHIERELPICKKMRKISQVDKFSDDIIFLRVEHGVFII